MIIKYIGLLKILKTFDSCTTLDQLKMVEKWADSLSHRFDPEIDFKYEIECIKNNTYRRIMEADAARSNLRD